jgi:hypothetical protein
MVPPLGALSVGPTASTTEFGDDVDGRPPRGRYRRVRQWPPPSLKTTSMADSLGALPTGPAASTTEFGDDVDGRPLGGTAGESDSGHHRV